MEDTMQPTVGPVRRGVTLTEVVISTPLVGLLLVAAMTSTGGVLSTWNLSKSQHDGQALAEQLMAEVLQQYYEDPDSSSGLGIDNGEASSQRKKWDDVDDYNGWSQSPPEDKDKFALTGYDGWTRAVTVAYVRLGDPSQTTSTDEGLKRITVAVTDPGGETTVLEAFRSHWGAVEAPPTTDATLQTYVTHELQVGGNTLHGGAHVKNHAE